MKVTIDRFEGDYVIVELPDKTTVNMPKQLVPMNAKEGDVIKIEIDFGETTKRKERIQELMDELWS
ncbi:MAG TPA: DUF3006 domain-containing protein [Clostridiaceae bacterium]|nr:DUF3006 domain-containing protein [Clostridiaceae bacterium]